MVGELQEGNWPLPKFYFSVDITTVGENMAFQEVSGLDLRRDGIESRAGNSTAFSKVKMPGMIQSETVTLKRGIVDKNSDFWNWHAEVNLNTIARQTVTIKLLDEDGNASMAWTLHNAFPIKVTGTDLRSESNEVAVDAIELVYERLTIGTS